MLTEKEAAGFVEIIAMCAVTNKIAQSRADELIDTVVRETQAASVFVVVCHDRHSDDSITVHATRESADARIAEFQAFFTERIVQRDGVPPEDVWREERCTAPWVRNVRSHDDGPSARIETTVLR